MKRDYPFVFDGGPLDGHEIEAIARTAIYRDASGDPMSVTKGDRLVANEGGIYFFFSRPMRTGRSTWKPGKYKWLRPMMREGSR